MQMLLVLLVRSWRDAWIYTIDGRGIGWLSEGRHARTSRDMVLLFSARAVSMLPVHVLYIVLSAQRSAAQLSDTPLRSTGCSEEDSVARGSSPGGEVKKQHNREMELKLV